MSQNKLRAACLNIFLSTYRYGGFHESPFVIECCAGTKIAQPQRIYVFEVKIAGIHIFEIKFVGAKIEATAASGKPRVHGISCRMGGKGSIGTVNGVIAMVITDWQLSQLTDWDRGFGK